MGIFANEMYKLLETVQYKYTTTVRQLPLDEPRIQVDLNTRQIKISESEYSDFLSMEKDHRAETVYFELDRYFEDVDLFNCTCIVEYINAKGQMRIYPVTLKDIKSLESQHRMILGWSLGNEATAAAGTITFSLSFYAINTETHSVVYSLQTAPAQGNILYGMDYTQEQEEESEDYYKLSENHFETLLAMINQKNVYWNDL